MTILGFARCSANASNGEPTLSCAGRPRMERKQSRKPQQLRPELIDLSMPVINGLDAARILKRLMPSVPLIMYSAFGDKLIERQARLIGIRELVPKSQDAAVLISKARSLLTPKGGVKAQEFGTGKRGACPFDDAQEE